MGKKLYFKDWFASVGNELLKGWLRAKAEGNGESFADFVIGEYDCYRMEDSYEIPYHGVCDSPSKIEAQIEALAS